MRSALGTIVKDYGWIHLSVGLLGNLMFFAGSILFLPAYSAHRTTGVWLFVVGSLLMLVGAAGRLLVDLVDRSERAVSGAAG